MRDNEIPHLHTENQQKEVGSLLMLIGVVNENQQQISGFHYLRISSRVLKSLPTMQNKIAQGLCHTMIR